MSSSYDISILKSASMAFSRNAVTDVIKYNDFSQLDWVLSLYSKRQNITTYLELLDAVYRNMAKHYRCEYVYKNEIIKHLVQNYKKSDQTVVFNEFRVGDSIADLALFNGESKAFEIKTEYDSSKRLEKQMKAYKLVFDKCYVVVPEEKVSDYLSSIDETTGIITLTYHKGHIGLLQYREAMQNMHMDAATFIRCLRTKEYEHIVSSYYGKLPDVGTAQLFTACLEKMSNMPTSVLRQYFLSVIKKRKNDVSLLKDVPRPLAQLCVALNLNDSEIASLVNTLNTKIQ